MNKIIWNHTSQNWVIVSELSPVKSKTKPVSVAKIVKTTATTAALLLGFGLPTANATLGVDLHFYSVQTGQTQGGSNYKNDGATGEDSLAAGIQTNATAQQAIAIGSEVTASGEQSLAIGNNVVANMLGATAIGNNTRATAIGAQAFGQSSNATAKNSAAIGRLATATGERASAFGVGNTASGASSFSGGDKSKASGSASIAIGLEADASGNDTIALGSKAKSSGINGIAIGKDAAVTTKNSIALGSGSKDREATSEDSATVNGISYSNFAGNKKADGTTRNANEISVVSVGTQYNERQIINVAPGNISATSTDAINGSQLYMTQNVIGNISKGVANIVGGNTIVNQTTGAPEGFTQTLNMTGDTKDTADYKPAASAKNVSEAITQLNNYVNAGWKLGDANGTVVDRVTPNDQVNFKNGSNTNIQVTSDGKTSNVTVNITGLPITYTTKQNGKDVPVVKVGDKYYPVGEEGKPDMTKPVADLSTLSTNLVNPEAGENEIGKASQLSNVANGANTFVSPKVDNKDIKLANDGKWYFSTQLEPNGLPKANSVPITSDKVKNALNATNNGGLINFAESNPNNAATVGDLQNLGFVISTADDQYKEQVRNSNRIEFVSANKNATMTGTTRPDGVREVKVTISDTPVFKTVQIGGDNGPKIGATTGGDIVISKQENGNENAPARITNVAPGVDGNDAVTMNQLKEVKQNLGDINNLIKKNNKKLHAGIAGSNAAAGLPQVYIPGKSMIAAAAGTYGGQNAVAIGYSRSSDNGKVILKLQGNANTNGRFGGSVGVGYQW
ncbi:MAG: YadA-like family protein [Pasteurella oralis]|uniref:YadA-like family protein n=1 Tax=Pasteurella oralis TaxID=1071947 RepID=UPI0026F5C13A|nr:YadA-like family protein [Pasteurella oralis]